MIDRYKILGILEVCYMVKSQGPRGKIGMSGWGNKMLSIKHTRDLEFQLRERRPLNETILVVLAEEVYGEVAWVADTVAAAEEGQFL